jgi:HAMP domain-containing protein
MRVPVYCYRFSGRSLRRLKDAAVRDDAGDYAGVVKGAATGEHADLVTARTG